MNGRTTSSQPIFIFDGDCAFCRRWITRWQAMTGDRVEYAAYQQVADSYPDISVAEFQRAAQFVDVDGTIHSGAEAVFQALAYAPGKGWPLRLYRQVPGVARCSERLYRFVAGHRRGFSALTTLLWGADVTPPGYLLVRWLFVRLIGAIYLIAFLSLSVQIIGLVGENGILPAGEYLSALRQRFGTDAYWRFPTLAWLNAGDDFLRWLCWAGALSSLLVILRIAPALFLLINWALYLSLYHVGQTFLSFQWDLLLLEAGLLAVFFAPWCLWPRLSSEPPPSRVARWLLIWLLFRLMFCSGMVKLLDDNPVGLEWHHLTALTYHYETQCLPPWTAWYAHQLPQWLQKLSVLVMFVIEIGIPFLFFLPRRLRLVAFALQVFLQLLIIITGNYNFFNWLTLALCVVLLDDGHICRLFPRGVRERALRRAARPRIPFLQRMVSAILALGILTVSGLWMAEMFVEFKNLPTVGQHVLRYSMRLQSVNTYGLFRHMTTSRPEIIIEGSHDGRTWKAYEFRWKPGNLQRRPGFVAPHQPRLDWQMWFAALGDYRSPRNRWFILLMKRLLEGSPEVLDLLETNPFPEKPPRLVRATLYDYHFTDWDTRKREGRWWERQRLRPYAPVLSLKSFERR